MTVERLAEDGPGRAARWLLVLLVLGAAIGAVLWMRSGTPSLPDATERAAPAPVVTVVDRVEAREADRDTVLEEQGERWSRALETLVASLPVEASVAVAPTAAEYVVDSGTGRRIGVAWRGEAAVGTEGQWALDVELMRKAPARYADPCRPERWGRPGHDVLGCDVDGEGPDAVVVTAASSPAGGGSDDVGWTSVADVRDGQAHVQVRLTRVGSGDRQVPLGAGDLADLARVPSWHTD